MTRKDIRSEVARLMAWYGKHPPDHMVASALRMPVDEAMQIFNEVSDQMTAPVKPKRKYIKKPKAVPLYRVEEEMSSAQPVEEEKKREWKWPDFHNLSTGAVRVLAGVLATIIFLRAFGWDMMYFAKQTTAEDPFAWMMAVAIVGMVFLSVQIAISSFQERNWLIFVSSIVMFIGFGFYNTYITSDILDDHRTTKQEEVNPAVAAVLKAKDQVKILTVNEGPLLETKRLLEAEGKQLLEEQKLYPDVNSKEYKSTRNRLTANKASLDANKTILEKLNIDRDAYLSTPGYYTMEVKSSAEKSFDKTMDWWLAVSVDLAGPWLLSVSLFMRRKREEDTEAASS